MMWSSFTVIFGKSVVSFTQIIKKGGGDLMSGPGSSEDGGMKSSDFDASLPDNAAEAQAAKDAADESPLEQSYRDSAAREASGSLWDSIFGK